MIDIFALAVSHGLIALALWRLVWRDDLDGDAPPKPAPEVASGAKAPLGGGARPDA